MAGIIAKTSIEQVRAASDIVDVVGSYLQLKRTGNALKALCPFHKEKTPSFHVNPQRQIFHCFGCGAGGDVFKFVMQHENVDFSTAVKLLAQRTSIALQYESGSEEREEGPGKDTLYRLHDELSRFYHKILLEHETGEGGRRYLADRQLDGPVITDFQLGFAPDRPDALRLWAEKRKFELEALQAAGVIVRNEDGGYYDRFRGRLMFPLRDEIGRVVGFSGRIIAKDQHPAKYVNSPETPIFRKGRLLFGLDRARREILEVRTAIICEGQIDVIRCHAAGLVTAVAGLGTALTEEHARLLRRYADSIILLLDADTAGQNSALRTADIFTAAGLTVRAAALPPGEDPDSLVLKQGADALRALAAAAVPALDFQIDLLRSREAAQDQAAQLRVVRAVVESIAVAPSAVQQEQMARSAATRLNVSPDSLLADLRQRERRTRTPAAREEEREKPARAAHPADEVELARLLFHHPDCAEMIAQYLPLPLVTDADCRALIAALLRGAEHPASELAAHGEEAQRLAAEIMASDTRLIGQEVPVESACGDLLIRIRRRALEQKRRMLEQRRSELTGAEREPLDLELKQLVMDLHTLRRGWAHARAMLELSG